MYISSVGYPTYVNITDIRKYRYIKMYVQGALRDPLRVQNSRKDKKMKATVVKEYDAHIDTKKRIVLRDAESEYYAVRMFNDGHIMLEPRVLVPPDSVSKRTLRMMDRAAKNFKNGKVSAPIDLDKYL